MSSKRRKAREIALKALYQLDLVGHEADRAVEQILGEEVLQPAYLTFFREAIPELTELQPDRGNEISEILDDCLQDLLAEPAPDAAAILASVEKLCSRFPGIPASTARELTDRIIGKRDGNLGIEEFARKLVSMTADNQKKIDGLLGTYADNWTLDRMASLDRCILRFAVCELLYFPEIPINVTINEAIELAKKYSTERSCEFVNGILDKIQRECKPEKSDSKRPTKPDPKDSDEACLKDIDQPDPKNADQ